jgi:hypothetical protein
MEKRTRVICRELTEEQALSSLSAAIITQAIADSVSPNPTTAIDACLFLASDEAAMLAEVVGVRPPAEMVASGRLMEHAKCNGRKRDTGMLNVFSRMNEQTINLIRKVAGSGIAAMVESNLDEAK